MLVILWAVTESSPHSINKARNAFIKFCGGFFFFLGINKTSLKNSSLKHHLSLLELQFFLGNADESKIVHLETGLKHFQTAQLKEKEARG